MQEKQYVLKTSKGDYSIDTESNIIVYYSTIIPELITTTNYPNDWGLTRVFQHIINKDLQQGII